MGILLPPKQTLSPSKKVFLSGGLESALSRFFSAVSWSRVPVLLGIVLSRADNPVRTFLKQIPFRQMSSESIAAPMSKQCRLQVTAAGSRGHLVRSSLEGGG